MTTLYDMPHGDLLFVCPLPSGPAALSAPDTRQSGCHPKFLCAGVTRECGNAFEKLNTAMPLEVPAGDKSGLAIGICATPTTAARTLERRILVKIDGAPLTVATFE